jgi:hypothetical protein
MMVLLLALSVFLNPFECVPELAPLHHIEARNIYMEENGIEWWDVPGDLRYVPSIRHDDYEVWFRYSLSEDEYYMLVFNDLEVVDSALHPCAAGAITPQQYQYIIEEVQ